MMWEDGRNEELTAFFPFLLLEDNFGVLGPFDPFHVSGLYEIFMFSFTSPLNHVFL